MKLQHYPLMVMTCLLLLAVTGCGPSPDSARKQLADLRLDFTPADFVLAAVHGDAKAVKLFIAAGMDVNVSPDMGMSALIGASGEGHLEIMKLLIQKGAKVDDRNNYAGFTALLLAAKNGKEDAVKLLVGAGANVNETNNDGDSPLMQAAAKGQVPIVKFLLENHADPDVQDAQGLTALDCTDNAQIMQLLYQAGARKFTDHAFVEMQNQKALEMTTVTVHEAQQFVQNGGDPAQALAQSRKTFSPETVAEYQSLGMSSAQIAYMQLTALYAIQNATGTGTMFSSGPKADRLAELNKLWNDGFAAYTNAFAVFLNDPKADLNWRDGQGMTFLMTMAMRGQTDLVKALIAKGANPNLKDSKGKTAVDYAQDNNQTNIVELLRAAGGTSGLNGN